MGFASEIKALLMLPGQPAGINEIVLRDFLCDGRIDTSEETMFRDVWSMPGGHVLEVDLRGKGALHAGATLRSFDRGLPTDDNIQANDIAACLRQSIKDHLQGDVSIGSCLSGGLDSSSIVCLAHELRKPARIGTCHNIRLRLSYPTTSWMNPPMRRQSSMPATVSNRIKLNRRRNDLSRVSPI